MKLGRSLYISLFLLTLINVTLNAQLKWLEQESINFKIIYLESNSHLVDHILVAAEKALKPLTKIFDYAPSEKIIINIYDINDYGIGSATTVPRNIIRLSISQFEPGYENMLYTERFQWILSHELVHIVINDQSTDFESFSRKLFGRMFLLRDFPAPKHNTFSSLLYAQTEVLVLLPSPEKMPKP